MKLFLAIALFSSLAAAAPQVVFSNGVITALPDPSRPPVREMLDVLEQDGCAAQKGARRIAIGGSCNFLRGLYRYAFVDKETKATRTVFVEFTAIRTAQGHGFISAAPVELVAR